MTEESLKKVRRKNWKKFILPAWIAIMAVTAAAAVKLYVTGYPISEYSTAIAIVDHHAQIKGSIRDSVHVYSHYEIKDGELIIYGCLPSFWNRGESFTVTYDLARGDVSVNGDMIKSDGKIITKKALALYKAKHPYIGDMSSNGRVAAALDISSNLGSYLNSLQTVREPYGWTLEFQSGITKDNQAGFDATMESYAAVILALVDNCNEVSWTYDCNRETFTRTFTTGDADQKLGEDVKSFAASPEKVQELLYLLNVK